MRPVWPEINKETYKVFTKYIEDKDPWYVRIAEGFMIVVFCGIFIALLLGFAVGIPYFVITRWFEMDVGWRIGCVVFYLFVWACLITMGSDD